MPACFQSSPRQRIGRRSTELAPPRQVRGTSDLNDQRDQHTVALGSAVCPRRPLTGLGCRWSPSASSRPDRRATTSTRPSAPEPAPRSADLGRRGLLPRRPRGGRPLARPRRASLGLAGRVAGAEFDGVLAGTAIRRPARRCGAADRSRASTSRSPPRRASACSSASATRTIAVDDPRRARARRRGCVRLLRAVAVVRPPRRRRPAIDRRQRARRRGVPAPHEPRRRSAAAHARRRRQPRPGRRRPLVGARRAPDLRACANGRLPLPGALRHELTRRLGRRWTPVEKGVGRDRRCAGASAARVLPAARGDRGGDGAARLAGRDAAQIAALATRRAKDRDAHAGRARARVADHVPRGWV